MQIFVEACLILLLVIQTTALPANCVNPNYVENVVADESAGTTNPMNAFDNNLNSNWRKDGPTGGWIRWNFPDMLAHQVEQVSFIAEISNGDPSGVYGHRMSLFWSANRNRVGPCPGAGWNIVTSQVFCNIIEGTRYIFNSGTPSNTQALCISFHGNTDAGMCGNSGVWTGGFEEVNFILPACHTVESVSASASPPPSNSQTPTPSGTPSRTPSLTPSRTPSISETPTISTTRSITPTRSRTPTRTPTRTRTPSVTPSQTPTPSVTPSQTPTPSVTPSQTPTPSVTPSQTPTVTPSRTPSGSPTPTQTPTSSPTSSQTPTPSRTPSRTPTRTPSNTPSSTNTPTPSRTPTPTRSTSPSNSYSPTRTNTPTSSRSTSSSQSASMSSFASLSNTPSTSNTASSSSTMTSSPTVTRSNSPTRTQTVSPSTTSTKSSSLSQSESASRTNTLSPTPSLSIITTDSIQSIALSPTVATFALPSGISTLLQPNESSTILPAKDPSLTPSRTTGPTCINCGVVPSEIPNIIIPAGGENNNIIVVSGEFSAQVNIPSDSQDFPSSSTVYVQSVPNEEYLYVPNILSLGVIQVTAYTSANEPILIFTDPVEICLTVNPNAKLEDACLSYLNEDTNEWKCQDPCLTQTKSDGGERVFCGQTDHFTNFAILLGPTGTSDKCESSDELLDSLITYLSISFICAALVFIAVAIVLIEVYYRHKRYEINKLFQQDMQKQLDKHSSTPTV